MKFYLRYMMEWPDLFLVLESPTGSLMSYLIAKVEGKNEDWHGHVTAITVSPMYRRLGFARSLMSHLDRVSEDRKCYYVDLFVRQSNSLAISMYEGFGFVQYRKILQYYSGAAQENAFDMRKSLSSDKDKKAMIPLKHPVHADDLEYN